MSTVADTLNGLKQRLDVNGKLAVQSSQGVIFEMGFTFHDPAQEAVLSNYPYLPEDYQQFLRLHDGANFFTFEYGGLFGIYSLKKQSLNMTFSKRTTSYQQGKIGFLSGD